jgi:DNA-binding FadR family transcriptional regulator
MLLANGNLDARHLFEVRAMLEVPGAELAAANRTDAHLAELSEALFDPDGGIDQVLTAIRMFHVTMGAASGNPLLQLIALPLYALANERDLTLEAPEGYLRQIDEDHRQIMAAVTAGDGPAAAAATRRHLAHLGDTFQHSKVRL